MEQQKQPPYYPEDEITLKEVILKLQEYGREVWRNWKIVALIVFPFVAFFIGKAMLTPVVYPARLTFMVNEDEGGRLAGMSSLLGQFGFSGGSGKYNLDKIVELARSRQILEQVIFEKAVYQGKEDYIGNHIIREYGLHKEWKKDTTGLQGFLFTHIDKQNFTKAENKALQRLYGQMVGISENNIQGIYSVSYNDDTSIFTLSISGKTEELSLLMANIVYDKLNQYYVDKTTEKYKITTDYARAKVDSLEKLLNSRQLQLLRFEDRQQGLVMRSAEASKYQLQRDISVYAAAYAEAMRNLEIAEFSYKTATPFWQTIDLPIPPLKPKGASKRKALMMGGLLGGFLGVGFVVGRRILRETMSG